MIGSYRYKGIQGREHINALRNHHILAAADIGGMDNGLQNETSGSNGNNNTIIVSSNSNNNIREAQYRKGSKNASLS